MTWVADHHSRGSRGRDNPTGSLNSSEPSVTVHSPTRESGRAPITAARLPLDWEEVSTDLRDFEDVYNSVMTWPRMSREQLLEQREIIEGLAYGEEPRFWPSKPDTEFYRWLTDQLWVTKAGADKLKQARREIREAMWDLRTPATLDQEPFDPKNVPAAVAAVQKYMDAINSLTRQIAPERFTYNGFTILNPDRLLTDAVRPVLDAVDWLVSLFKRRKVEPLLRETLDSIMIDMDIQSAGLYSAVEHRITIKSPQAKTQGKMIAGWMHEILLHEMGHHTHLNHLTPEAKAAWDEGWEFVDKAKEDLNKKIGVTHKDRLRFYELIKRNGYNPMKAGRKVKGIDRLKYLMWLYKPTINRIISTPNQVRLTGFGRNVFQTLADPMAMAEEHSGSADPAKIKRLAERLVRQKESVLGVSDAFAGSIFPTLDPDTVEQIRSEDTSVDKALDALGIPTEYGRTNEMEDFAETFVLFMVDPRRLSPTAYYRMGRALWLSGSGGKPVMRMANRLAERWLQMNREESP